MKMIWCGLKIEENCREFVIQFHEDFHYKTLSCWKIESVYRDVKWRFKASWGLERLKANVGSSTFRDCCVLVTWQDHDIFTFCAGKLTPICGHQLNVYMTCCHERYFITLVLNDRMCHLVQCQIRSFNTEATIHKHKGMEIWHVFAV